VRVFFASAVLALATLVLLRRRRRACASCKTEAILPGYRLCGRCIAEHCWQ